MRLTWEFSEKSKEYIRRLPNKLESGVSKGLVEAMFFAELKSKEIFVNESSPGTPAPLPPPGPLVSRSGRLRESIQSGAIGNIGWIGTNVKYGKAHEFGIHPMPERPFLQPSLSGDNMESIKDIIIKGVMKEMTK